MSDLVGSIYWPPVAIMPLRGRRYGLTQVAVQEQPSHVSAILLNDGVSQPHLGRDFLDNVRRRHTADDQPDGVARNDTQQSEDDRAK